MQNRGSCFSPLKSTLDFALFLVRILKACSAKPATYPCLKDHSYTFFNLESLTSLTVMRYIFSQGLVVPWQELTLEVTSILSSSVDSALRVEHRFSNCWKRYCNVDGT